MIQRLRARKEWRFFGALRRAAPGYAAAWWGLLIGRALLTGGISIATGWLIGAVQRGDSLAAPLSVVGVAFTLLLVAHPINMAVSSNLGNRMSAWLYDALMQATTTPPGMGHLERPDLINDLTMARDFDLGMMGPPLDISMDFIAGGLLDLMVGSVAAVVLVWFGWWQPIVLVLGWCCTHWLLRESGVWKDRNTDEVRTAQRHAEYSYRMAVDAGPSKELRLFGLADWVVGRFIGTRTRLYELQYQATRLREKSLLACLAIVLTTNAVVFWSIADAANSGEITLARTIVFLQSALGVGSIAFGGLNWALDGASSPVEAVLRLRASMAPAGHLDNGTLAPGPGAHEIRFRDVGFAYPQGGRQVLEHFDLTIPAGSSLAIVGQNGAGKTTLAKLLCRLYDPQSGAIEIDGTDLRQFDIDAWRHRVAAVFQDFIRFELPLRDNVAPGGASDELVTAALVDAGADHLARLDTPLAKGYADGTELSGGQWQRVALARALAAVRLGAGVVLLDEPTAQLDVRGEAEIFGRVLSATRECTTIIISHRFSTVRQADRIAVVEHGVVVEHGSHDELMAVNGRYRTMYDLQAMRFTEVDEHGEELVHDTL